MIAVVRREAAMSYHRVRTPIDLAEAAPAFGRGAEIDFAGVLDGQHMPALRRHRGLIALQPSIS
jgi:hypothetical protein